MPKSINAQLAELYDYVDRLIAGEFPARSPMGPGVVNTNNIKAKAVTAPLISVSNLQAVNTQTGNLNVDGVLDIKTGGRLVSGTSTSDWATFATSPGGGLGYYLEYHSTLGARVGFGDFNNTTGQYVKWDGTTLTVKGVITASAGVIAGWTIGTDALISPSGDIGLRSSGGLYTIWAGNSNPALAEFAVTALGQLYAVDAIIDGDITADSGEIKGLLTITGSGGLNMTSPTASIRAGKTSWADTSKGLYLSGGTNPLLNIGDSSNYVSWNGATLDIRGNLLADSGQFLGSVVIASGGNLRSGQTAYDTGTGFFLEANAGTPRFSLGNSAGNKLTWNGTTLALTGTVTASAGTIGGWTLGSTTLTGGNMVLTNTGNLSAGSGASVVRLSADDATYRLWVGNATAASAAFRVSSSGAMYATNGHFAGEVDTGGEILVNGDITVSGGKIKFGASGADYLDNNLLHFEVGSTDAAIIEVRNGSSGPRTQIGGYASSSDAGYSIESFDNGTPTRYANVGTLVNTSVGQTVASLTAGYGASSASLNVLADSGGGDISLSATDISFSATTIAVSGAFSLTGGSTTGVGSSYGRIPITIPGVGVKYLQLFNP